MQQHQQQVRGQDASRPLLLRVSVAKAHRRLRQMRQQAAACGPSRAGLPNGPLASPTQHHAGLAHTATLNHTALRPNGSCSPSPSARPPGRPDKSRPLGGGGMSNGNVPYPQQNSLPHNCTAANHPSTSSTTCSPGHAEETWRSQPHNTSTQVPAAALQSLGRWRRPRRTHCVVFSFRGFKKVQVRIRQVPMENPLSLPPPPLRPRSLPLPV